MPYVQNASEVLVERLIDAGLIDEADYYKAEEIVRPVIEHAVNTGSRPRIYSSADPVDRRDPEQRALRDVLPPGHD